MSFAEMLLAHLLSTSFHTSLYVNLTSSPNVLFLSTSTFLAHYAQQHLQRPIFHLLSIDQWEESHLLSRVLAQGDMRYEYPDLRASLSTVNQVDKVNVDLSQSLHVQG